MNVVVRVALVCMLPLWLPSACGGAGDGEGGAAQSVELLANGSFEAPSQADGTLQRVSATAWSGGAALINPNAGGGIPGNPFTFPQPSEGQQYNDIGNLPSTRLSQSFTVTSAGTHRVAWKDNTGLNAIPGFRTSPYSVAVTDGNGRQVYSANFDAYRGNGVWEARSTDQVLAAGTYTLSITSLGTTGNGTTR